MFKIDEGLSPPYLLGNLGAGHNLASARDQQHQHFGRLGLKFDKDPIATQLPAAQIELETTERNHCYGV